jgi:predicted Zn-dependent protease
MSKYLLSYLLFVLALLIGGCAVNPVTGQQDLVLMSEQEEIALGRKTNQQVLQQYSEYDDPALQSYVQSVGEKLAAKSHRSDLIYRFTVLDSREVNAFALPGGYIYITRGLMSYLNSEAELAAVLGHEIGHVTARHSVRQYSAAQFANIGATLGALFIPGMNTAGSQQLAQLFGTALLRGYGREHELEADSLGAEYLARTSYNPKAMLDVVRVLKNQEAFENSAAKAEGREPNTYHGLFATHPDNDTRLQEVIGHADKYYNPSLTFVGREIYLEKINGMVFGDSEKEGILRGHNFYHADLGFAMQLPRNWNVKNRPDQLLITAPGGAAIMQIGAEDLNKRISPREFMQTRLNLKKLAKDQSLTINGLDAHTGLAPISTSFGSRTARFTVIYFDNRAYIMAGVAKDPETALEFDPHFLASAQSFHAITANERLLARPLRLNTIEAGADTRFSELAKNSPLESYQEEQLRLINALYPQGEPQPGMLLKVLQ